MEAASLHSPAGTAPGTIQPGPSGARVQIRCSQATLRQQPRSCQPPATRGACPGEQSSSAPQLRTVTGMVCWTCGRRSEEHTSELQSQSNLVCRLLLEKKKMKLRHKAFHT